MYTTVGATGAPMCDDEAVVLTPPHNDNNKFFRIRELGSRSSLLAAPSVRAELINQHQRRTARRTFAPSHEASPSRQVLPSYTHVPSRAPPKTPNAHIRARPPYTLRRPSTSVHIDSFIPAPLCSSHTIYRPSTDNPRLSSSSFVVLLSAQLTFRSPKERANDSRSQN